MSKFPKLMLILLKMIILTTYNIDMEKIFFNNLINLQQITISIILNLLTRYWWIWKINLLVKSHQYILNEIDIIAITKQYEFINASFTENIKSNKIDIEFTINETQKLYVDRINIFGNDITNETVIRDLLIVDEGDL